jgi:hypothetical protein
VGLDGNHGPDKGERLLRSVEDGNGIGVSAVLVPLLCALTYIRRSLGLLLGVAGTCCVVILLSNIALRFWPHLQLGIAPSDYEALYLAEFAGILAFGAITVAIGIWKFSFAETRLVQQAANLRDKYIDLAYFLEKKSGQETPGTIALKGIGESFDRAAVAPSSFNAESLNDWVRGLAAQPEVSKVPPVLLMGTQSIKVPVYDRRMWTTQVALALRYILFCAIVALSFSILGKVAANPIVAWCSVLVVVVALQATLRFITSDRTRPLDGLESEQSITSRQSSRAATSPTINGERQTAAPPNPLQLAAIEAIAIGFRDELVKRGFAEEARFSIRAIPHGDGGLRVAAVEKETGQSITGAVIGPVTAFNFTIGLRFHAVGVDIAARVDKCARNQSPPDAA